MKYYLTCTLALCLFALPAIAQKAKPSKGKVPRKIAVKEVGSPKLIMESLEHDFGKIKEGRPTSYSFLVKNEGTRALQIENVAPT